MNFKTFSWLLFTALTAANIGLTEEMGLCKFARMFPQLSKNSSIAGEKKQFQPQTANTSQQIPVIVNMSEENATTTVPKINVSRSFKTTPDTQGVCTADEKLSNCLCTSVYVGAYVGVNDTSPYKCRCQTDSGRVCLWLPQDCYQLYEGGISARGVFTIQTTGSHQLRFSVRCVDGRTYIQVRESPEDFNQNWAEYQSGFGNLEGNFWLGNEKVCHMTEQRRYRLGIYFTTTTLQAEVHYDNFSISCANGNYTLLSLGSMKGQSMTGLLMS
ncbi:Tenascin-R [Holothuria leucospilota]|uniref:Tenascin-R n=1 Tax=Holothuria leucospilota TaxID=206669 RepID=A0A9Q1H5X4_HOLLE|nr:Tenascin-R [Holothuria leucospilota]